MLILTDYHICKIIAFFRVILLLNKHGYKENYFICDKVECKSEPMES